MRNKVLVVVGSKKEREHLEQMLQEIVEMGGELFLADSREDGLTLLKQEAPHLVFLDADLVGTSEDEWVQEGVHIVLMRDKHDTDQKGEDFILKPLKARQVHEKCRTLLPHQPVSFPPPM